MPGRLTIHDTRLEGNLSQNNETGPVFRVNESNSLADIFNRIVTYTSQNNGLDVLFIIAHGVENLTVFLRQTD